MDRPVTVIIGDDPNDVASSQLTWLQIIVDPENGIDFSTKFTKSVNAGYGTVFATKHDPVSQEELIHAANGYGLITVPSSDTPLLKSSYSPETCRGQADMFFTQFEDYHLGRVAPKLCKGVNWGPPMGRRVLRTSDR